MLQGDLRSVFDGNCVRMYAVLFEVLVWRKMYGMNAVRWYCFPIPRIILCLTLLRLLISGVQAFLARYDKDVSAVSRGLCPAKLTREFWCVIFGCLRMLSRRISSHLKSPLVAGDVICVAGATHITSDHIWCGWHQTKRVNCVWIVARKCFALRCYISCIVADRMSLVVCAMMLIVGFAYPVVLESPRCWWIEPRGLACEFPRFLVWSVHDMVAGRCYIPAGRCLLSSLHCDIVAILSVHVNSRRKSPFVRDPR